MLDTIGDNLFYCNKFLQLFFLFPMSCIIWEMEGNYLPFTVSINHFEKYNFISRLYFFTSSKSDQQLHKNFLAGNYFFKSTIKANYGTTFLFSKDLNRSLFLCFTVPLQSFSRSLQPKKASFMQDFSCDTN